MNNLSGILNINKPAGFTSFDVVAVLRKTLKMKRIGHTGTLDPDAKGVLPICIGKATGAVEFLIDKDKIYRAVVKLGIETDTGDATGKIISTSKVECDNNSIIDAVNSFQGKIKQIPPMYSALKVDGRKLCDLARSGITIEREARDIEIYSIVVEEVGCSADRTVELTNDCIDSDEMRIKCDDSNEMRIDCDDSRQIGNDYVVFTVHCSKGTYIRTLCEDIGKKLGCGAHMEELTRLSAGNFKIEDALTLDEIKIFVEDNTISEKLISVDKALEMFDEIHLSDEDSRRFLNGVFIKLNQEESKYDVQKCLRVYSKGLFLALGSIIIKGDNFLLKSKKLFVN